MFWSVSHALTKTRTSLLLLLRQMLRIVLELQLAKMTLASALSDEITTVD